MLELTSPWALLLLLLPPLWWLLVPRVKAQAPVALKVPFFAAMKSIVEEKRSVAAYRLLLVPGFIWLCLVIALANPRWVGEPLPLSREGHHIMMALDLSGSMEIPDMFLGGRRASRLAVVKKAAKEFVENRTNDKIGLVLFGTRAYLQTPLTYDKKNLLMRLEDATAGLAGQTTSIGDAIGLSVKRLSEMPKKGRVIILLTDGVNNSGVLTPLKAAELSRDEGIKLYTIGLGAESNAGALGLFTNASADLDEDSLKKIAEMTGGRYFRATDTASLQSIYQTIHQLETVNQEQATVRPQKDYYPWFAGLALLLSFYWLAREKMKA